MATVRRKHQIAAPAKKNRNPRILTLREAVKRSGVNETTLMRLINAYV